MAEISPRERVWQSIRHNQTDRVPWHFPCTIPTRIKLENHFGTKDLVTVLDQNLVKFSGRANQPAVEIKPDFFRDEFGVVLNRTVDKDIGAVEKFFVKDRSLQGFQFPHPHDPNRSAAMLEFAETHKNRFRLFSLSFSLFERAWILRGMEDLMVDMLEAPGFVDELLDAILAEKIDPRFNLDSVEPKLFGMGLESYTTGSMEFYLAYAVSRKILLTLDAGHFHPTETIGDKISALMLYLDGLMLHVSRGVRWDSDYVVTWTDDLQAIARAAVRSQALEHIHFGLDYFDASINRIAAWTIGARGTLRALLMALLEPVEMLSAYEKEGDFTSLLGLQEELISMPFSAVWDAYCTRKEVPAGMDMMAEIKDYEKKEPAGRV